MNHSRWMLLALIAGLSACAGNRPAERATYDLHLSDAPAAGTSAATGAVSTVSLRVDLRMAAWLDNTEISYRFDHDSPARLRQYADSRWAGRAGQLVGERVQSIFGPAAPGARCTAKVDIAEFTQHFVSASQSRFVLDARWSISNTRGERLLADARRFTVDAPTADARGGVAAAALATGQLGQALLGGAQGLAECK